MGGLRQRFGACSGSAQAATLNCMGMNMLKTKQFRSACASGLWVGAVLMVLCGAFPAAPLAVAGEKAAELKDTTGEDSARERRLRERERERENQKAELEWTNAESAFLVNDFETARKIYLTIVRHYPTSDYCLRSLARVGDVYRAEKFFPQAIEFYRNVLAHYAKLDREQQKRLEEHMIRVRYMIGATYYEQKNYRQVFGELRAFIQNFPDSKYANVAYFLIGQSHLANNNYRAAIGAFESVGTAQGVGKSEMEMLISPGDTLYVQVRDPDMRTAAQGQMVKVQIKTSRGDMETLLLKPKGIGSDLFVNSIKTRLGSPEPTAELERLWSVEVDDGITMGLRKAEELAKRVEELKEKREKAKEDMGRISKDESLTGQEQLDAIDKQKEIITGFSSSIATSEGRSKIERESAFSQLDAAYAGIETFLGRRAPDQTITSIKERLKERLEELKRKQEKEGETEEVDEEEDEKAEKKEKEAFSEEEILEVRESVQKDPTDEKNLEPRRAVLRYWMDRLLHDLKRVEVVGDDTITVYYKDDHVKSGMGPEFRQDSIRLAANGFVGFVSDDLKSMVSKIVYSSGVYVEVVDFDQDVTNAKDSVQAVLSVIPREDPKDKAEEEKKEGEKDAKEEAKEEEELPKSQKQGGLPTYLETYAEETQYRVLESKTEEGKTEKIIVEVQEEENPPLIPEGAPHVIITLTETGPHSGVFVAVIPGTPSGIKVDGANLTVSLDQRLRASYEDERNISRRKPWVVWSAVEFVPPGEGNVESPKRADTKLNRRAQLEKGISEAELAKVYEDLGLADRAGLYFEKALRTCASVALLEGLTPLGEEATHAIWNIYFESGQTEKAISACRQLIKEFPGSNLVDEAYLVMGKAHLKRAEEADEKKKSGHARQAVVAFSGLLQARPKSEYVPQSIYSIGLALLIAREGGTPYMERVVKEYPDSPFAALALEKSGTYAYRNGDYTSAYEYFTRILTDYPDATDLDKIMFARGHCKVKVRDYSNALRAYYELTETYPGSAYARKAQKVIDYLKKAMAKAEAK